MRKIAESAHRRRSWTLFPAIPMAIGPRMMREVMEAGPAGFIKKKSAGVISILRVLNIKCEKDNWSERTQVIY